MDFKLLLDEVIDRGERIKKDVLDELFKSKTVHDLVTSKSFVAAVSKILETKDEVKKVIGKQVKHIFDVMDVPTKAELRKLGQQIGRLESEIGRVDRKRLAIKALQKHKNVKGKIRSVKTTARKKKVG